MAVFLYINRSRLDSPAFKRRYGALYLVYRDDLYMWEVHLKLKKLLVMSAVVFFSDQITAQVRDCYAKLCPWQYCSIAANLFWSFGLSARRRVLHRLLGALFRFSHRRSRTSATSFRAGDLRAVRTGGLDGAEPQPALPLRAQQHAPVLRLTRFLQDALLGRLLLRGPPHRIAERRRHRHVHPRLGVRARLRRARHLLRVPCLLHHQNRAEPALGQVPAPQQVRHPDTSAQRRD
eukprot:1174185-Prorocentrum_minimum.AAC.3